MCPEDDVIDYMVMEAVALRVQRAERDAEKQRERNEWKKEAKDRLSQYT
jgi:hypothetical protein